MNVQQLRGKVDYGIITIRPDEFTAVLDRLPDRSTVKGGNRLYEFAHVHAANGREKAVAVVRCPDQGHGIAQAVARDLIDDLDPSWLLLVGIAGGMPTNEFTLGDVLLASRVHDFAVSAAIEGREPQLNVGGGRVHQYIERLLGHLPAFKDRLAGWNAEDSISRKKPRVRVPDGLEAEELYGSEGWKRKVIDSISRNFPQDASPRDPIFYVAPTGSSNTLVKNTELASQWLEAARAISHIEMELGGVYQAARTLHREYPVLAIRSLSDIVGYRRDADWTGYACQAAAAFCLAMIKASVIDDAVEWNWNDSKEIPKKLDGVFGWLSGGSSGTTRSIPMQNHPGAIPPRLRSADQLPGILIIGPGGTGKSTLMNLLTCHYNHTPFEIPGPYYESIRIERSALRGSPGAMIVVPPGQEHRRGATWDELFSELKEGKFRGIILLLAYGYHTLGEIRIRDHKLYKQKSDKRAFLKAYLEAQRQEELAIVRRLGGEILQCSNKLWLLTLVGKEDLWSSKRSDVIRHYDEGVFRDMLSKIQKKHGDQNFRHAIAFASLVISNFTSSVGERLATNSAGYDHELQVKSLRKLIELFDSLRMWEEGTWLS